MAGLAPQIDALQVVPAGIADGALLPIAGKKHQDALMTAPGGIDKAAPTSASARRNASAQPLPNQ